MRLIVTVPTKAAARELERMARERGWRTVRPKPTGRPRVTTRPGFAERWAEIAPDLLPGRLSQREAAARLGCGVATVVRLKAAEERRQHR